ncbi:MAG: hypothetical protein LUO93_09570 [Methanomicrobiales archaeon]|nr:hypothetical protein [Methanomicrobiales archaeon]
MLTFLSFAFLGLSLGYATGYVLGRRRVAAYQHEVCEVCRARRDFTLAHLCERCMRLNGEAEEAAKVLFENSVEPSDDGEPRL